MKFGSTRRANPTMDMTPLIDVVFQLLLFFMLSTTFRNSPNFEVQLPEVSSDKLIQQDNSWTLMITKEGSIVADNMSLEFSEILSLLQKKVKENPDMTLIIEADEVVPHKKVVQMMDLAQEAGVETLQIGAAQQQ